ncbi:MAG: hypothetical protein M3R27_16915 [Bacteroidota bacterium]|nr:hypothetical protein [Bacteroidota bacterium]
MRFFFFILCYLLLTRIVTAAESDSIRTKTAVFIGAGNYEYLHLGFNSSIKQKHYVEIAAGIKPWGFNTSQYQSAYLLAGTRLFKKRSLLISPSIHLKCIGWHFNNRYNRFVVLGINPELRFSIRLKNHFSLSINAGGLYNTPLYYERKTFEEVSWPKEWQPSFSFQLFYYIK